MGYQVIIDTDYLLETSKNISDTSNEIGNSILSLQKMNNDLDTGIQDQNIEKFKTSFNDFLTKLNGLTSFYNNVSTTINSLAKEYDNVDQNDAVDLKKNIDSEENAS